MKNQIGPFLPSFRSSLATIILILCFGIGSALGQKNVDFFTDAKYANEWWYPLIKKHNVNLSQYTFGSYLYNTSSQYNALELGQGAHIVDTIIIIKNPLFIIKENEEEYNIVTAESATHNLKISQINWEKGKMQSYKFKSTDNKPIRSISFSELKVDTKSKRAIVKGVSGEVNK